MDALVKTTPARASTPTFPKAFRPFAVALRIALIFVPSAYAQEAVQAVAPALAAALPEISATRIQTNVEKLVSFGTRSTLSAQDPASVAAGHGIGAAREWIKSQFERYSKDCGGCLEVKTDAYTQAPAERIPQPTQIVNVYAVMKGTNP